MKLTREKMNTLIIEDTKKLANTLKNYFHINGNNVDVSYNLEDAYHYIAITHYDIILLDIMLPDGDGRDFLQNLRKKNNITPIIVMTAKFEISDKVDILDLGADDYIIKPFEFIELEARCRAVLRRKNNNYQNTLSFGNVNLFPQTATLEINGHSQSLRNRELRILEIFFHAPNIIFSKNQITDRIFSISDIVSDNTIEVYIARIRKKIEQSNVILETMRGIGYKLTKKN